MLKCLHIYIYILSGMEGGLKLLLNIEVFEHMRGSNLDSGVKVRDLYIMHLLPIILVSRLDKRG